MRIVHVRASAGDRAITRCIRSRGFRFARASALAHGVLFASVLAAAACRGKSISDTDDGGLDVLRTQAMVPGESLGAIRLNEMTISKFAGKFGSGFATIVAGDEVGIELSFRERQLSFLFLADGPCDARMRSAGRNVGPLMGDRMRGFLERFPECSSMPLHSIAVWAGPARDRTFYQGKVANVVGLWDDAAKVTSVRGTPDGPARFVAGMRSTDNLESYRLQGVWIGHERIGQGADGGSGVVRYITVFRPPESP